MLRLSCIVLAVIAVMFASLTPPAAAQGDIAPVLWRSADGTVSALLPEGWVGFAEDGRFVFASSPDILVPEMLPPGVQPLPPGGRVVRGMILSQQEAAERGVDTTDTLGDVARRYIDHLATGH